MPRGFGAFWRLAFGLNTPRQQILGSELSGDVIAVGSAVRTFGFGDAVFGVLGSRLGAHIEHYCLREKSLLLHKPHNISYELAAALAFGGMTALDFFRRAKLDAGERILINGASGAVGSTTLQLEAHGGGDVTTVCSAGNAALMSQLGYSRVLDYREIDFVGEGIRLDVTIVAVGNASHARVSQALRSSGRFLLVVAARRELLGAPWVTLRFGQRLIADPTAERADDLRTIVQMAEAGAFSPLIDTGALDED